MSKKRRIIKILSLLLVGILILTAAGCGSKSDSQTTDTKEPSESAETNTEANTEESSSESAETGEESEMVGNMYKTGVPIVKEPVTYHFLGMNMNPTRPGNLGESDMMKKLEEETNVRIEWELIPQASWTEKKNLIVASGEYPDAFFGPKSLTHEEVQKFGADGILIDIEELLDEYAPNINKIREEDPFYDSFIRSADGKIYQLAAFTDEGFDSHISTIINKEWLDNLNLSIPTDTEELYNVLKAFKEQDPNGNGQADEIPMSFLFQEGDDLNREVKRDFRPIYYAFGIIDTPFYISITDDDEVIFTADKEEWKAATEYMHKLYSEDLIDPEVFTQDRTLLTNKLRTQKNIGVYFDYRKDHSMILAEDEDKFTFIPALKSPDGKQIWARAANYSEGAFAITSACENPEVLIRWIDYCNQPEYAVQMAFGMFKPEGYTEKEALVPSKDAPGKYEVNSLPEGVEPSDWPMSAPIKQACSLVTKEALDEYVAEKASSVAKLEACEVYRPYLSKWPYNYAFKFTPEEVSELSLIQTDIVNYIIQTQARWITDGGIEEEWDDYLAELERMDVDRYLELYKTAFERVEK